MNAKKLSWKAKRRGAIYCAPACGFDCTFAAYQKAQRDAKALAKRLGDGWTPRVWENLGWYYSAVSPCGRIKVHPPLPREDDDMYSAFLGPWEEGGRWVSDAKTPEEAVRHVKAKATIARLGGHV